MPGTWNHGVGGFATRGCTREQNDRFKRGGRGCDGRWLPRAAARAGAVAGAVESEGVGMRAGAGRGPGRGRGRGKGLKGELECGREHERVRKR